MKVLKYIYEKKHHKPTPYYYDYTIFTIILKPVRKWVTNVVAYNCPFNNIRILLYKLCGFRIGQNTFIGMHCYLDDMCFDLMKIGNNVTISYGVYFACHGKNQGHNAIVVKDGAYIGMRANVIAKNCKNGRITIGENAIVGAGALVNRDVPDGCTAVGVPIRIISKEEPK